MAVTGNNLNPRRLGRSIAFARKLAIFRSESGAITILVALSLLIILGMVGLAMDAGQMFMARQQLQAAADAGAQAGVMDMYNGTNSSGGTYGQAGANCAASSTWTPCKYAVVNGLSSDTVCVDFPTSAPSYGSTCSTGTAADTTSSCGATYGHMPCYIRVTASRTLTTILMNLFSQNSATVTATAVAAITQGPEAVPIVVTHPHLQNALSTSGNSVIVITGGPTRTIQVNSQGDVLGNNGHTASPNQAFTVGGNSYIDISGAGPSSTGGGFLSVGPGDTAVSEVNTSTCAHEEICLGSTGAYTQPTSVLTDPFGNLSQPTSTGLTNVTSTSPVSVANGAPLLTGCATTCADNKGCSIYSPGIYDSGIDVKNTTAYFQPGLYYISTNDTNTGFNADTGSTLLMLSSTACTVTTPSYSGFSNGGMLVFNGGGGSFKAGSNGNVSLVGSDSTSTAFEGILFWQDRTLTSAVTHTFGGGGNMTLTGTIYANMSVANVTYQVYDQVNLSGNSGNTTNIIGQVITNALSLGGSGQIHMTLSTAQLQNVRVVALVQ